MLDARERRRGLADRVGRDPEQQPDGDGGQRVRDVVGAGDAQLADRHDPAVRARRRGPAAGQRQALDVGRHDPAVDDAEPARQRPVAAVAARIGAGAKAGVAATTGSSALSTSAPSGGTSSASRRLTAPIRLERAVPVEVVRGHVRVDGHGRAARQGRQLQLRELVDDPVVGRELGQPLDDRDADVAAQHDGMDRVRGEDRRGQRRGRGLALRAGHPDRRGLAQPQEQVGLRHQGRRRGVATRRAPRPAPPAPPGAAARSSGSRG